MKPDNPSTKCDRRNFLRRGAGAAGGLALAGAAGWSAHQAASPKTAFPQSKASVPATTSLDSESPETAASPYQLKLIRKLPYQSARRIASASDGRIFIAADEGLGIWNQGLERVKDVSLGEKICSVAYSEQEGSILAGTRKAVLILDPEGREIKRWNLDAPRAFLTGLAFLGEEVLAADAGRRRILHFAPDGRLIREWDGRTPANPRSGFVVPSPWFDAAAGADGLVRVTNPGRHRVDVLDRGGEWVFSWGGPGRDSNSFSGCCNPISLALFPDGRCVTAEKGAPQARLFDEQGRMECFVAGPEQFEENALARWKADADETRMGGLDAAVGPEGAVWILDIVRGTLSRYERAA